MSAQKLPEEVRAMLYRIETYEQLDVVLALAHEPQRVWTLDAILQRAPLPSEDVPEVLDQLSSHGLLLRMEIEQGQGEQGWLAEAQLQGVAPRLLEAYRDNVVGIVRELTENAFERLRTGALRTFADAFVVRRGS